MKHALTLQNWRGNGALWRASIKILKIPRHDQTDPLLRPYQLSRKLLRILDRLGCFSFLSAFASIWRMRSRVTENCRPHLFQRVVGIHADAEAHANYTLLARRE